MSWISYRLGDICDIARGGSPRPINKFITNDEDGINWIKIADATRSEKYIYETKEKIKKEGISRSRVVNDGDFLLSNSMSFGRPYIVRTTGCIHDGWLVLSKYQKHLDVDFFYYLLLSPVVVNQFENLAQGSTVRNLNKELVSRVEINIPPLATQQKIVAKLDAIFAEIDKATAAAEANAKNAEALFQSYLTEVFERGGDGWNTAKLKDVVSELITGPFGSALHKSDYVESGIPVINPQNLINGKIIPLEKTMVSQSTKERLKKYSLKNKDIVIARRGEMGRCGLVDFETEGWLCGTGSMIIRLNEKANENFIFQLLQSNRVRKELESSSIGATMSNLNQSILLDVQFTLPPIEFQIKTLEAIKEFSLKSAELTKSYLNKVNEYSSLKQSILKQAFSGELVKE